MKCQYCDKEVALPFKCQCCNKYYCPEHRLPENHECPEYWRAKAPREAPPITPEREPQYEFTISYTKRIKPFSFSHIELKHLTISALIIMVVGLSLGIQVFTLQLVSRPEILLSLAVVFTLVFLLHELAHKLVAQHYGLWAEFRLTISGAFLTLLSIISPIKIVSPGAVMIAGFTNKETVGKIALAGPLINLALSMPFITLASLYQPNGLVRIVAVIGTAFNAWIAVFNLIPTGILDGYKVFLWNKTVWGSAFITSIALTIFTYVYIF